PRLALAGQHSRFARPALPNVDTHPLLPEDERPLIPDAARPVLIRLFAGKNGRVDDAIAVATVRVLKRNGSRLHPFDLSRLEDLVARHADELGPYERAWLHLVRGETKSDPYADEPAGLTEDNFTTATRATKLAFLRLVRGDDPARARRLIESVL